MAEQNTSTEIGDDNKEETAGSANSLWGSGDFSAATEMMDALPHIPTSEQQFLELSERPPSFGNTGVAGLEAGNSSASVSECPGVMYGPYRPDEPEIQSLDVKDSAAEKGVCGLKNLGNTCFMNAGLQCLLSCASICKFFCEEDGASQEMLTGQFHNLVQKVWCGQYSVIRPSEFKETLGFVHGQFKDFRQHDGQEFLALLLDSLHEELNLANNKSKFDAQPEESVSEESSELPEEPLVCSTASVGGHGDDEESSRSEMSLSEPEESMDVTGAGEMDGPSDGATNNMTKLPSIEEFYMKDVKTLNTNVLREDSPPPVIALDSDKFPKNDKSPTSNKKSPLKNKVENKTDASPKSPRNKKTNLLMEKKKKIENLETDAEKGKIQLEVIEGTSEIDTIKRMKMDDSGTILKSLFFKGGGDVIGDTSIDIFSVTQDIEDVERVKQDLANLKRKDTNLFANSVSKFPISANNESCNVYSETDKLGKFAGNTFSLELNMEYEKQVNCAKDPQGEGGDGTGEGEGEGEPPGAKSDDGTLCKQITFANNQTLLINEVTLAKSSSCSSGATVCMNSSQQNRAQLEYMQAEKAWDEYLERNRSVIVDTFQGQFKSTVVCSACDHVSVTFEPFMYLSLPLPHAMERQIVVVWVSLTHHQPMTYLVTLLKTQTVKQLRVNLMTMIFGENVPPPNDVVLAEVFDNHVARVLEDGTYLRYVNDDYRQIYAFEMAPKPDLNMHPNNLYCSYGDFSMADSGDDYKWRTRDDDVITESGDVGTAIDDVTSDDIPAESAGVVSAEDSNDVVMQLAEKDSSSSEAAQGDVFSNIGYFDAGMLGSYDCKDAAGDAMPPNFSQPGHDWNVPSASNAPTAAAGEIGSADINNQTGDVTTSWVPNNADTHPWTDDTLNLNPTNESNISDWRSCAVCLEELPNHELLTHMSCGGSLCHICLEATSKHYGTTGFQCPVCTAEVNPAEDFVAVPLPVDSKASKRILTMPVQFRYDYEENGQKKMKLFGHPRMVYLSNEVQGEVLFCAVERLMPFRSSYKIVLTDGQGYHCSRCMYNLHCSGCELVREVDISVQSGDHLTVVCDDIMPHQLEYSGQTSQHESMKDIRKQTPLTLQDCFRAFTESELLDEHNPWYCPKCEQSQCARKTLTVWRYPDTLVVYLKRFVFHELCSTKLDNKVLFPIEELDVSAFISGPMDDSLVYDLQSCVCHFGGVNAGHYTAYCKNPLSLPWYYYNDDMITRQEPGETDASSVYVLFYQRKDVQVDFMPAQPGDPNQEDEDNGRRKCQATSTECPSKDGSEEGSAINHEEIDQLLEQLQSSESGSDATQGRSGVTSYDFYN